MITMAYVWLIIAGIATLLFFGLALVLAIRGIGEMRELLENSGPDEQV
jgi:hypothetical protein